MLYRAGVKWKRGDDEGWVAQVTDRIQVLTWPFGYPKPRHQCKIFINYPMSKSPHDQVVGFCLETRPTRDEAMKAGVEYARKIIKDGVPGPEETFKARYENWPTLYRNRLDIINHLFFVIGGGDDWLNGGIINTSPESHLKYLSERTDPVKIAEGNARNERSRQTLEKYRGTPEAEMPWYKSIEMMVDREGDGSVGPLPDNGKPRDFYPISEGYSNICLVPDDVRDDWLAVAYEAAVLLRDRSCGERQCDVRKGWESQESLDKRVAIQRAHGIRLIQEFRTRFPDRVPMEG